MSPQDAVLALIAAGWSEATIANRAGVHQTTVNRLKLGKVSVRYEVGAAVVALAAEVAAEAQAA